MLCKESGGLIIKHIVWLLLSFALMQIVFAAESGKRNYRSFITISSGCDLIKPGRAQTLTLLPPFQNHYTNTSPEMAIFEFGALIGIEKNFNHYFMIQSGLSAYIATTIYPEGRVWQFGLPEFETLSYAYKVYHTRLMFEGKLLTFGHSHIHPYLSLSLGAAFNQAKYYHESPFIAGATPTLPFTSHSQTSFSFSTGLGIDYNLTSQLRLGAGYQFADLGSVSLGPTPAATTTQTLNFSHIYTHQIRLQLTGLM